MTVATKTKSQQSHSQQAIRQALSLCRRHQQPISLLAIEMSEVAALAAEIGHERTQTVTQHIGRVLNTHKRCEDILVRYSTGSIMLAVLPATPATGANALAERLMSQFEKPLQVDEFQIEVPLRVGVHTSVDNKHITANRLINDAVKLLRQPGMHNHILLSPQTQTLLAREAGHPGEHNIVEELLQQQQGSSTAAFIDTLMPALSAMEEQDRMILVDRLLELSTRNPSRLACQ
ncbi:hypothetical protein Q670_10865 [Alcanivorax sp. P2S70]|uniref:Diguanylate cyclase n=1 Tax=Alcanivorax profundi TaxID=2338368 RepID=A0A418Y270_9GAMM|nr:MULTISPECIES: diguanylate cyclase [Alcanivorax]ERP92111.1 hypothetical protein Q670_10865 [Alcanivorax sp. P2S70]RJG19626.1 diguanylate cyclase [Alcanivorax profundi]